MTINLSRIPVIPHPPEREWVSDKVAWLVYGLAVGLAVAIVAGVVR